MATVTLAARVSKDFRDDVDALAKALNRDRAWVVEQALRRYLAEENQFIAAVKQGRTDIAAGRFATMEEMEAELDSIEAEVGPRQ